MRNHWRPVWESRSPLERSIIATLAVVIGALLYLWLVQSAQHARTRLGMVVADLRAQAIGLDRDANEIARLRAARTIAPAQSDLRYRMQARIAASGLSHALVSMESVDAHQVKLVFAPVAFADWLAFADTLQSQHIRLDAARIEAVPAPGWVSVTATFVEATQ